MAVHLMLIPRRGFADSRIAPLLLRLLAVLDFARLIARVHGAHVVRVMGPIPLCSELAVTCNVVNTWLRVVILAFVWRIVVVVLARVMSVHPGLCKHHLL